MAEIKSEDSQGSTLIVPSQRTIFFISDRTAITAITLGQSLLTQFDHIDFEEITLPFIDTVAKAKRLVTEINNAAKEKGGHPIVFSTLVDSHLRHIIKCSDCLFLDFFETFISSLETEFSTSSSRTVGRYHRVNDKRGTYDTRIDAVNFAINNDDGITTKNYEKADVILTGVSRTGKTPTCLYLALQFGIYAANYPMTEENVNVESLKLPRPLRSYRKKIFGLNITPERLHKIRSQRRPNSTYASLDQCRREITLAKNIFTREAVPNLNVTAMSVEEIASTIIVNRKLKRRH